MGCGDEDNSAGFTVEPALLVGLTGPERTSVKSIIPNLAGKSFLENGSVLCNTDSSGHHFDLNAEWLYVLPREDN